MKQTTFAGTNLFSNRKTEAVTFRGKLTLPIHRWYRLTPSFSPQLVEDIADHFDLSEDDHVLDPFSGVGTVPLCLKYRRIPTSSIELNPYLHFVSAVKTTTYTNVKGIERGFDSFLRRFKNALTHVPLEGELSKYLLRNQEFLPPIKSPDRWWSPGNLAQLTCLRKLILNHQANCLDLLQLGVLSIVVPVSNAKYNHVSLTFANQPLETVNLFDVLQLKFRQMAEDLRSVEDLPHAPVTIYKGNSKAAAAVLPKPSRYSAVITSPPYPNRFSYARETRPHLFFLNFIRDAQSVGEMEKESIAGTWGRATSSLNSGITPYSKFLASLLAPYTRRIEKECALASNYVTTQVAFKSRDVRQRGMNPS
jgi:hypothetical protein